MLEQPAGFRFLAVKRRAEVRAFQGVTDDVDGARRDHGGGLDAAIARFGGTRDGWIDLSTGINPVPYNVPDLPTDCWTALPDSAAQEDLLDAARALWGVPEGAAVLAASGASALIAQMPSLAPPGQVAIVGPTYNEHAAAFAAQGWQVTNAFPARAMVAVHPNNPDGRLWSADDLTAPLCIIDESFGDVAPEASLVSQAARPGRVVLKSFGKFWGLAGLRLGFAIAEPALIATLQDRIGPWGVSGPALHIAARALRDRTWAEATRVRLQQDSAWLDGLMQAAGAQVVGGTTLFRLYEVGDAAAWQTRLAHHHIWSRCFPYASGWLRLGLPHPDHRERLQAALFE